MAHQRPELRQGEIYEHLSRHGPGLLRNHQRQLEYDFVVRPGVDPRRISLAVQSQSANTSKSALRIDRNGDLVASVGDGEVRFRKPVVYQPGTADRALSNDAGQDVRSIHFVDGKYLLDGNRLAFDIATYDKTKPLVIDPMLAYSTYLGGSGIDAGAGIAVDASGNAYVTGNTSFGFLHHFPTTPGAFQGCCGLAIDVGFVSKFDADGSALIYSTYLGGVGPLPDGRLLPENGGTTIAVDLSGNAYVTGLPILKISQPLQVPSRLHAAAALSVSSPPLLPS